MLVDSNGKASSDYGFGADINVTAEELELGGKKGVTELDRLAYVVSTVEKECQIVPIGALKMNPLREVRRNEGFKGLRGPSATSLDNYVHFRGVLSKEKRDLIDRDEGIFNPQFLDLVSSDPLKGAWSVQKDTTDSTVIIRNKLWPGYYSYHRTNSSIYGGLYIGSGIRNNDLPFML